VCSVGTIIKHTGDVTKKEVVSTTFGQLLVLTFSPPRFSGLPALMVDFSSYHVCIIVLCHREQASGGLSFMKYEIIRRIRNLTTEQDLNLFATRTK